MIEADMMDTVAAAMDESKYSTPRKSKRNLREAGKRSPPNALTSIVGDVEKPEGEAEERY